MGRSTGGRRFRFVPLWQCGNLLPKPGGCWSPVLINSWAQTIAQTGAAWIVSISHSLCWSGAFKNKPVPHSFATERETEAHRRGLSCTASGEEGWEQSPADLGLEPSPAQIIPLRMGWNRGWGQAGLVLLLAFSFQHSNTCRSGTFRKTRLLAVVYFPSGTWGSSRAAIWHP